MHPRGYTVSIEPGMLCSTRQPVAVVKDAHSVMVGLLSLAFSPALGLLSLLQGAFGDCAEQQWWFFCCT